MTDQKLDSYLSSYTKFNDWLIKHRYQLLSKYFKGRSCLEMGSAEGAGTPYLLEHFDKVTIVDGSKDAIESVLKQNHTNKLTGMHSYFEDMDFGKERFDTIVLAHILEHVDNPNLALSQAKKYLSPGGVMIIDVPNGNSLHRQIGVKLGILKEKTELNEADLSIGHQRVYTPESFRTEIKNAGLEIINFGGMFIKVLSNSQTEKVFNDSQLEALFKIGEDNAEVAAEIYIIAKLP